MIELDGGEIVVSSRAPAPLVGGNYAVCSGELRAGTSEALVALEG